MARLVSRVMGDSVYWSGVMLRCCVVGWSSVMGGSLVVDWSLMVDWGSMMRSSFVVSWCCVVSRCFMVDWGCVVGSFVMNWSGVVGRSFVMGWSFVLFMGSFAVSMSFLKRALVGLVMGWFAALFSRDQMARSTLVGRLRMVDRCGVMSGC